MLVARQQDLIGVVSASRRERKPEVFEIPNISRTLDGLARLYNISRVDRWTLRIDEMEDGNVSRIKGKWGSLQMEGRIFHDLTMLRLMILKNWQIGQWPRV